MREIKPEEESGMENIPVEDAENVFSEITLVKREILHSYFGAVRKLGTYVRHKTLNKEDKIAKAEFIMLVINLYQKLRPLILKKKMHKKIYDKINTFIVSSDLRKNRLEFKEAYEIYKELQIVIEKTKIYGIGFRKTDPLNAWSEGLK